MRRKILLAAVTTLLLATSASSQNIDQKINQKEINTTQVETPKVNLSDLQSQYNQRSDQIPDFVGSIIGDQTITLNLSQMETGSESLKQDIIGIKTNGVKTEDIQWGAFEKETLKIWITEENIETLSEAEEPPKKLKEMMKTDQIRYETYTLGNAVKFGIMELFMSF